MKRGPYVRRLRWRAESRVLFYRHLVEFEFLDSWWGLRIISFVPEEHGHFWPPEAWVAEHY